MTEDKFTNIDHTGLNQLFDHAHVNSEIINRPIKIIAIILAFLILVLPTFIIINPQFDAWEIETNGCLGGSYRDIDLHEYYTHLFGKRD